MMQAYRVTVTQQIKRTGEWQDGSFTSYHDTMRGASYVVNRFTDCDTKAELESRRVMKIEIETIYIEVTK